MLKVEKKNIINPESLMSVKEAVYKRQSVRSYSNERLDKNIIQILLDAAVHAPTAIHEEPCAFVVIEDKKILKQLSEAGKKLIGEEIKLYPKSHALNHLMQADFNLFYNAGTLIVIYAKSIGSFVSADCWLAAENLILTAYSMGLGTCVIGSAVAALNSPTWKANLGIPSDMIAIAPIIVGVQDGSVELTTRKKPEILIWK